MATMATRKLVYLSKFRVRTRPSRTEQKLMRLFDREHPHAGLHEATEALSRAMIRLAQERHTKSARPNISGMARSLGVARHTLYRMLRASRPAV